ncbi:MAG: HDOD domain-containing protein [Gammaproteobacteria bacterium]|nr:HDOD domain-containing protein [Gammaproteobacteria bacterium]
MPASLHEWVDRLRSRPLPAMAFTIERVTELMARSSSTHTDYHSIIARDPGFALSIFRHLGNLPKPPREPITTLTHALSLSGVAPLEAGVKNLPVIEPGSGAASGLRACYSNAVHAAIYLSAWAAVRQDYNPEELMLAALLHNCGEMSLWCAVPDQMNAVENRVGRGWSRENASLAVFGFTLNELSLRLAETWRLPPLIGDSMSADGAFRPRSLGVMLAVELARCSASAWDSEDTLELIGLAAEYCRQKMDHAAAALHSMSAETARRLYELNLPAPAAALLQLRPRTITAPQNAAGQVKFTAESVTRSAPPPSAVKMAASDAALASALQGSSTVDQAQCLSRPTVEPALQAFRAQTSVIETPATETAPVVGTGEPAPVQRRTGDPLQTALTDIMKKMREGAGLERAMFALLTPDRKTLRARFIIGAEKDAAIKTFQVNLDKRHLFSVLMLKPQSLWLNVDNRSKYLPMIPPHLHNSLNHHGFFVSSLFIDDKPVGILYADSSDAAKLDSDSFTQFRQLAQQLGANLSNARKNQAVG